MINRNPILRCLQVVCCLGFVFVSCDAMARQWSDQTGEFKIEADLIAFSDQTVVLKRSSGRLVAIEVRELSEADQTYLKSKEASDHTAASISAMQTWTSRDGMKVRGRILGYGSRDLVVERRRGSAFVNDEPFARISPLYQKLILKILSHLEGQSFDEPSQLQAWVRGLGGEPKSYLLDGVMMELESGDKIAVPFFLFASDELEILRPGWENWLQQKEDTEASERESFLIQSQAMQYQQDRAQQHQIEILKLNMLAAATGVISLWEVGLQPAQGAFGRQTSVIVPASNSAIATEMALQQYPGFQVFGVRRIR